MTSSGWWHAFAASISMVVVAGTAAYAHHVPAFVAASGVDKILHVVMGATLACSLDGALFGKPVAARGALANVPLSAVVILVPVGLEEYLQRFAAGRTSSYADFAADALGVAVGVVLARCLRGRPRFTLRSGG